MAMDGNAMDGRAVGLDLVVDLDARVPVIAAAGVLDLETAPQLRAALTRLIYEGASELVLDLRSVDFVDSTALGVIARAAQQVQLVVRGASPPVRRLFTITMLDSMVRLEP
jgi:anti-sigma B factor antagonist